MSEHIQYDPELKYGHYSRDQLRLLLYLYPYLLDAKPPKDESLAEIKFQAMFGPDGWRQKSARKRAEVDRAIKWLNQQNEWHCYCVRAWYIVGLSTRAIADYIQRIEGRTIHPDTANDWRKKGFEAMLEYLNGER